MKLYDLYQTKNEEYQLHYVTTTKYIKAVFSFLETTPDNEQRFFSERESNLMPTTEE